MIAAGISIARRESKQDRPRVRRSSPLRPALDGLEGRTLMAVALSASPIRATANATTGLIPVATIGAFQEAGAPISPGSPGTATISWGDGTSSTAISQVNLIYNDFNYFSMGRYGGPVQDNGAILAAHTYAKPGTYPIGVTLTDPAGQAYTTATTATVSGKPGAGLGASAVGSVSAATNASTGLVPVATFTDQTSKPLKASAYKAQVDWGDGVRSAGMVRVTPAGRAGGKSSATIEVLGTHTFTQTYQSSEYATGVTVTLTRAGAKASTTTVADVSGASDPNPYAITSIPVGTLKAQRGRSTGNLTVAKFRGVVIGGVPPASNYPAQVAWGDGTTGAGTTKITSGSTVYGLDSLVFSTTDYTATSSNFLFQVSARHTYRQSGTESIVTSLGASNSDVSATTVVRVR